VWLGRKLGNMLGEQGFGQQLCGEVARRDSLQMKFTVLRKSSVSSFACFVFPACFTHTCL